MNRRSVVPWKVYNTETEPRTQIKSAIVEMGILKEVEIFFGIWKHWMLMVTFKLGLQIVYNLREYVLTVWLDDDYGDI